MLFTTADGADLFYEVLGSPDDQGPVVFLNGIMMTTRSWGNILPTFTPQFDCVLHDFRGQLRSPYPASFNIEQHADDLAALLDHVGIERVDVVGTSYGGEVGMIFAYTYPERVKSLTVIACASRADEHMRQRVFAAMNAAMTEHDRLYDIVARDFFSPDFLREHPEVVAEGRARVAGFPDEFFAGYVNLCDAFTALDITDNLRAIRCPTLVIAAERDTLKPLPYSEAIVSEVEGSRLLVVPDAGHAVVIERPDVISRAVLEFLG
jgi:3-oxoadipate enol-lactonase